MKKIIHHIRRQPEHVRKTILHLLTLVAGVLLVLLWIYSLTTTLTSPDTQTKVTQDLQPFSAIKDNISGGYNSLVNQNSDNNTDQNTNQNTSQTQ